MFFSPLEQFDFIYLLSGFDSFYLLDIANITLYFVLILLLISFIFLFLRLHVFSFNLFHKFFENIYFFIIDMLVQQAGVSALKYLPYIFATFIFILFSNLIGMLPFGFTIT